MDVGAGFEAFYQQATLWINLASEGVDALPVSYAFGAGMLASVNPCGFVMLPAFGAFFVTTDGVQQKRSTRILRALWMGVIATAAFIVVFTFAGAVIWAGGRALMEWVGWAGIAVGVALSGFGLYQLVTRRSVFANAASAVRVRRSRSAAGALVFGTGYAVCSLGCTLPAFLVVAGSVFIGNGDFTQAMTRFVEYAAGMGLVLTVVTVSLASARGSIASTVGRYGAVVEPTANVLLVLAGLYVIWYWTTNGVAL
jgi:cytochrome c-type biogenesis protein